MARKSSKRYGSVDTVPDTAADNGNGSRNGNGNHDANRNGAADAITSQAASNCDVTPHLLLSSSYKDHFTLQASSCIIRSGCKNKCSRVFQIPGAQLVLEETHNPDTKKTNFRMKHLKTATKKLQGVRAVYTAVAVLFTGFVFAFFMQILLNLVLDLTLQSGQTSVSSKSSKHTMVGIILAIVGLIKAFSSTMVIAGRYCEELWTGHVFLNQYFYYGNANFNNATAEWFFSSFMLLMPLIVLAGTLLLKVQDFWRISSLFWLCSVAVAFLIFMFKLVYFELNEAIEFMKGWNRKCDSDHAVATAATNGGNNGNTDHATRSNWSETFRAIHDCIIMRQVSTYSDQRTRIVLHRSDYNKAARRTGEGRVGVDHMEDDWNRFRPWGTSIMKSSWLQPGGLGLFHQLETPKHVKSVDDVREYRPFLVKSSWGLERIFCRPAKSRYIGIVSGSGALDKVQINSSFYFYVLATAIWMTLGVGVLVWFNIHMTIIFTAIFCMIGIAFLSFVRTSKLADFVSKQTTEANRGANVDTSQSGASMGVLWEYKCVRTTEPTERMCWILFVVENFVFIVYPFLTLCSLGNTMIAGMFLVAIIVYGTRYYLDVAMAIEEAGTIEHAAAPGRQHEWMKQSCLSNTVGKISNDETRVLWSRVFWAVGLIYIYLSVVTTDTNPESKQMVQHIYLDDFMYEPPSGSMMTPVCSLMGVNDVFGEGSTLLDYVFLAGLAYNTNDTTTSELDGWFRTGLPAAYHPAAVIDYKKRTNNVNSAASFKLFTIDDTKTAIVSIRGTQNAFDVLADSQLWSSAVIVQGIRLLLPFGNIWTPILETLVAAMNIMESKAVQDVSFDTVITPFIKELKESGKYDHVQVTGHSLGGGLAMITGSQAKVPAVAVSGPNAVLSGASLANKVNQKELNKYTFNIVPDRDIVPRIDDLADNFKRIKCNAPVSDFIGCHDFTRALCEIATTCGSANRPVLCACHTKFNFPLPVPKPGTKRTFEEACADDPNKPVPEQEGMTTGAAATAQTAKIVDRIMESFSDGDF